MKLHEEFKLYENMWEESDPEVLEEKKAKPYTKRKMADRLTRLRQRFLLRINHSTVIPSTVEES